jgi:ligand-binding sensor domain-containing protein
VGTQNGIFRYDGFRLDQFGLDSGLPTRSINALHEDASGRLWVGLDNEFGFFWQGSFHIVRYSGKGLNVEEGSTISSLPDGRVFLASSGSLFALNESRAAETWNVSKVPIADPAHGNSPYIIHSVVAGRDGALILGCGEGICELSSAKGADARRQTGEELAIPSGGALDPAPVLREFPKPSNLRFWGPRQGLPPEAWNVLLRATNGDLWARGASHVAVLKPTSANFADHDLPAHQERDGYLSLAEDKQGRILTFSGNSMARWQGATWTMLNERQGLPVYEMTSLLVDRDGELWFGSSGHGLNRWLGYNYWEHWTATDGLRSDIVWAILRDRTGRLWVGTDKGLAFQDRGQTKFTAWAAPPWLDHQRVQTLAESKDGAIWLGTFAGNVVRIDRQTSRLTRVAAGGAVYRLLADTNDRVWIANETGLFVINASAAAKAGSRASSMRMLNTSVKDVTEAPDGRIFFRTETDLLRFDSSGVHKIQLGPGLRFGGQWAELVADGPNSIWTDAAAPGIVHMLLKDDRVVRFDRYADKALGSTEAVIVERDHHGRVWIGEDIGVNFLDGGKWRRLTQDEGLIWNDCDSKAFFEDVDGSIFIGTSGGLSHLLAPKYYTNSESFRLTSVAAKFGDRNLDPHSSSTFAWNKAALTVKLATLRFHNEMALRLHYRLLGLEQNWTETTNREIRYPQLGPGSYTLEAFATDSSRAQNSDTYRISFVIVPPWWQTKLTRLSAICLFGLSLGVVWTFRVRSLMSPTRIGSNGGRAYRRAGQKEGRSGSGKQG